MEKESNKSEFKQISSLLKHANYNDLLAEVVYHALDFKEKHPESTSLEAVRAGIEFHDILP